MRTIRDYVGFILVLMLMIGCGSRSVSKTKIENSTEQKQEDKVREKSEQVAETQKINHGKTEENQQKERAEIRSEKQATNSENKTESKNSETGKKQVSKRYYHKTYYPNGQLKSEKEIGHETFEEFVKLQQENEYLKSSAVALREENDMLMEENKRLLISKDSLVSRDKKWVEVNNNLLKVSLNQQEILDKQTEREAYPWYWWVIGGVVIWEVLKLLYRNYFKYLFKIR